MRIIPLGGAHEVGASSTIVEFGQHRILVDAGIRIGAHEGDQLPDLSRIQMEAGRLSAIFLTHAHMDHSGALPLVHMAYPNVPIYMTPATAAVVRILLSDSLRLMEGKFEREGEIPLFPPEAVASCLGCIRPIPFDFPVKIAEGQVSAIFHPAGHILGASSITFQGRTGSLLISGDISVTDQRTVPGMLAPNIRPDVVMIESTYGDRLHAHRPTQEAQLIQTVANVVESGGKVIFPAFAVGRAQEIVLILRQAVAARLLPEFPIYVDGMVQSVCDAYSRFPTYLQKHLRVSLQKGENPFFPAGGSVFRVRNAQERKRVLEGPPCCIIASSGMMTGGPSAFYASHLASNRSNLIAITGYQDEEAPGRRLLDMAEAPPESRSLRINDQNVRIECKVAKYALSAHADSGEISGLIGQMSPSQGVILVHGDGDARSSLASTIERLVGGKVYTPGNGEILAFEQSRKVFYNSPRRKTRTLRIGGAHQPLDQRALSHLHQALWAESGRRGLYRLSDLHARWFGPEYEASTDDLNALSELLAGGQPYFSPDFRRNHLFRLNSPKSSKQKRNAKTSSNSGVLEMNQALQCVAKIFPDVEESGLYKKGARQEEQKLRLYFRFPAVAKKKYAQHFKDLEQQTGWSIELNDMPHHAALESLARQLLPNAWNLAKNPAIFHEKQSVRLRIYEPEEAGYEELADTLCADYLEQTGYSVDFMFVRASAPPLKKEPQKGDTKLEINRAYQHIEHIFAPLPHQPYKKSKKGEKIVLSFLSPEIGHRYSTTLDQISEAIGWPISINPEPNQYGIKQEVRSLFPAHWHIAGEPGVIKQRALVRVCLDSIPQEDELNEIAEEIFERTGFHLEVASSDA